jgi:uncharacterized protein YbaR (Trm112 family)
MSKKNENTEHEELWRKHIAEFACPKCYGELALHPSGQALDCATCHLRFPVQDGIPALRLDRAENY